MEIIRSLRERIISFNSSPYGAENAIFTLGDSIKAYNFHCAWAQLRNGSHMYACKYTYCLTFRLL